MAQRATGFAKKPVAAEPRRLDDSAEPSEAGAIALELAPLLAPYRKHGRLALRVERLPPRARLSRGHNNGDRSWSLLSDELDGLAYLPPKGVDGAHTLGIRIVSLDGGDGATLALLDYTVSPGEPSVVAKAVAPRRVAEAALENPELRRLREELAKATAPRAAREEDKPAPPRAAELAAARASWEAELEDRLAAAAAQTEARLETHRTAWQAEASANIAAIEQRAQQRLTQSRETWRRESETALAEAEQGWKTAEAARLAAAEAAWQRKSEKALADALGRAGAARGQSDDARIRALTSELAETRTLLGKRDAALSASEARFAAAETEWKREGASRRLGDDAAARRLRDELGEAKALLAARDAALAAAEARFASAEAEWKREGTSQKLSEDATARKLRDELVQARALLAEREADLKHALATHDEESPRLRRDAEAAFAGAQESWKAGEAARAAAARGEWQERSSNALSEAAGQLERARAEADTAAMRSRADAGELRRLKDDIANLKAIVGERNAALAETQAAFEQAREAWRADSTAAEAANQERFQRLLAEAAERLRKTEAALAEAKGQVDTLRHRGDPDDIRRLRHEFAALQGKLAEKDMELAHLRTDNELARERWTSEARVTLQTAERAWKEEAAEETEEKFAQRTKRRFVRDVLLAASLSAVVVMFFVKFSPATVDTLWPGIEPLVAWIDPQVANQGAVVKPAPPPVKVAAPAPPMLSVGRAANLRAGPSTSAAVIATLPRDDKVSLLGRHGNWVQVRADGSRQGWIYSTYLKDAAR